MFNFLIYVMLALPAKEGVKIELENTKFETGKTLVWETTIMKLGEMFRVEETFPNSGELSSVILWNGEKCWLFTPHRKSELIPPIRNGIEFLGFRGEVKEKGIQWEIEEVRKLPLKKEARRVTTYYKDYTLIEDFGYFPRLIEKYRGIEIKSRSELKYMETEEELRIALFDPELVEFTEEAKKLAKKLLLE